MAKLLKGIPVRESIKARLKDRVLSLGFTPVLAIVQAGDRADSNLYIKNKIRFGEDIGVKVELFRFGEDEQDAVEKKMSELAKDDAVNGIIIQLPLPNGFDAEKLLSIIPKEKDADGLSGGDFAPATARAVMSLLDFYQIETSGSKAAIIGRSRLAGGPIAKEFEKRGVQVAVCHRGTENMQEICRGADILVSAAGVAGLVTRDFVHSGQTVIDVGINRVGDELVGDVNFKEVEPIVAAISPVPGGVGPLTVACLFENLVDLSIKRF